MTKDQEIQALNNLLLEYKDRINSLIEERDKAMCIIKELAKTLKNKDDVQMVDIISDFIIKNGLNNKP